MKEDKDLYEKLEDTLYGDDEMKTAYAPEYIREVERNMLKAYEEYFEPLRGAVPVAEHEAEEWADVVRELTDLLDFTIWNYGLEVYLWDRFENVKIDSDWNSAIAIRHDENEHIDHMTISFNLNIVDDPYGHSMPLETEEVYVMVDLLNRIIEETNSYKFSSFYIDVNEVLSGKFELVVSVTADYKKLY